MVFYRQKTMDIAMFPLLMSDVGRG